MCHSACTGNHNICACETNPSPVNETLHSLQCYDQEDGYHLPSANGSVSPCHVPGAIYFTP